jgi:hypothetical protein
MGELSREATERQRKSSEATFARPEEKREFSSFSSTLFFFREENATRLKFKKRLLGESSRVRSREATLFDGGEEKREEFF